MRRKGFTLLELTVVVVIMTIAVGAAVVNLDGFSDQARLRAAGSQVAAVYRLAAVQAAASGLPQLLALDEGGCWIRRPAFREKKWQWSDQPRMDWPRKVRLVGVATQAGTPATEAPWRLVIGSGDGVTYRLDWLTRSGVRARMKLDGYTGVEEFVLLEAD